MTKSKIFNPAFQILGNTHFSLLLMAYFGSGFSNYNIYNYSYQNRTRVRHSSTDTKSAVKMWKANYKTSVSHKIDNNYNIYSHNFQDLLGKVIKPRHITFTIEYIRADVPVENLRSAAILANALILINAFSNYHYPVLGLENEM